MKIGKALSIGIGVIITGIGISSIANKKSPVKFSAKWFESLSDTDLNLEREIIRKKYCSAGDDFKLAVHLQNLLRLFDEELSKRAWAGSKEFGFPVHREHGWHLPSKD